MSLRLPEPAPARLSIMDAAGRTVRRVDLGIRSGENFVEWDGRREDGTMADPAVYFLQVVAGARTFLRKATLIH